MDSQEVWTKRTKEPGTTTTTKNSRQMDGCEILINKESCERRGKKKKKAELKIQCNTKTNTDATRLGSNGIW